jgi:hypothetical protein
MLVIKELGEDAAEYAAARAMVLQRLGDEIGASAWRRVAPVIEEMQRKKASNLTKAHADTDHGRVRQSVNKPAREVRQEEPR